MPTLSSCCFFDLAVGDFGDFGSVVERTDVSAWAVVGEVGDLGGAPEAEAEAVDFRGIVVVDEGR